MFVTTNDIQARITQIEYQLFIMEFKDHWTREDWAERAELNRKLNELRDSL